MSSEIAPFLLEFSIENQMHEFGVNLGSLLVAGDLLSLNGPLGAGKTTLTRGIGEGLLAEGNVSSPTFLIARTHPTKSGIPFHHIDAYRLSTPGELADLDIHFAKSVSVIEWGRGFVEGLSDSVLEINIERDLVTELRTMSISGTGRFSDPAAFFAVGS